MSFILVCVFSLNSVGSAIPGTGIETLDLMPNEVTELSGPSRWADREVKCEDTFDHGEPEAAYLKAVRK